MTACHSRSWPACLLVIVLTLAGYAMAETGEVLTNGDLPVEDLDTGIRSMRARLAEGPEDSAMRAELARMLGRAGKYVEALGEYDALINAHPDDVDHSLGRAQVFAWLGNDAEALEELERATTLAPDYEALWQLRFRLLRRRQPLLASAELAALSAQAESRFPQAEWWRIPQAAKMRRWQLTLGAGYESLSRDLPDWNSQFMQLEWLRNQHARYFLRLARDARFDNADPQFVLGGEWLLPRKWAGGLEINSSTNTNFHPNSGSSLHLGRELGAGWGVDFRWRQRRFDTATVSTYTATAERYFGRYRAAYGLNFSRLHGLGDTIAHTLALNWYMSKKHSLGVAFADGEEAEAVATGLVLQTAITSITFSGRHLLSQRLTLAWWAGSHRQGDLYRRNYVGMAVTVGI